MFRARRPSPLEIDRFTARSQSLALSYAPIGLAQTVPSGYDLSEVVARFQPPHVEQIIGLSGIECHLGAVGEGLIDEETRRAFGRPGGGGGHGKRD